MKIAGDMTSLDIGFLARESMYEANKHVAGKSFIDVMERKFVAEQLKAFYKGLDAYGVQRILELLVETDRERGKTGAYIRKHKSGVKKLLNRRIKDNLNN